MSAPDLDLSHANDPGFLEATEVFDEADQAQHQQLREMAAIQMHAKALNRPETHPEFDGIHCVSCGIDIPTARLAMHKVRCVDCQGELEEANARSDKMRNPPPRSGGLGWDD